MRRTILVVDDSPPVRKVLTVMLQIGGYEVIEAEDGRAGLACLDGRKIDLVVSDVHMPYLDGIGLMHDLRKLPRYAQTPVILLTSDASLVKRREGEAAGASAWLSKPVEPAVLLELVNRLAAH